MAESTEQQYWENEVADLNEAFRCEQVDPAFVKEVAAMTQTQRNPALRQILIDCTQFHGVSKRVRYKKLVGMVRRWLDIAVQSPVRVKDCGDCSSLSTCVKSYPLPALDAEGFDQHQVAIRHTVADSIVGYFQHVCGVTKRKQKERRIVQAPLSASGYISDVNGGSREGATLAGDLFQAPVLDYHARHNAFIHPDALRVILDKNVERIRELLKLNVYPQKVLDSILLLGRRAFRYQESAVSEQASSSVGHHIHLDYDAQAFMHHVGNKFFKNQEMLGKQARLDVLENIGRAVIYELYGGDTTTTPGDIVVMYEEEEADILQSNQRFSKEAEVTGEVAKNLTRGFFSRRADEFDPDKREADREKREADPKWYTEWYRQYALAVITLSNIDGYRGDGSEARQTFGCPLAYSGKLKPWHDKITAPLHEWYRIEYDRLQRTG